MSDVPPPQFTSYPRGAIYGSSEKLEALYKGYFGLNKIFLVNVIIALVINAAFRSTGNVVILLGGMLALFVVVVAGTLPFNKQIAIGKDWQPGQAILASILMGINSALCCGIIGYVVMQQLASTEIKKYGLKVGFGGFKKKELEAAIANLRSQGL